jgi:DNA-directed RNA polymerase specialized sigma24 family protein
VNGLKWLAANEEAVKRLARKALGGRRQPHLEDELWGVAVDRVERVYELWEEDKGATRHTFICRNLRWYFFKYLKKKTRRRGETLYDEHPTYRDPEGVDAALDAASELPDVLEGLSELDVWILEAKHKYDKIFGEIADELNCSKGTAVRYYQQALQRARDLNGIDPPRD